MVQNRQGALLELKAQKERDQVAADLELDRQAFLLLLNLHKKLLPGDDPSKVLEIPQDVEAERNMPGQAGTGE